MSRVLDGVRVLDFGRYIAGPYCAALLANMGADVIRIERPGGGEDRFLAPISKTGDGAMFMQMNAGKRGMTLNIGKPDGRKIVKELVKSADIVIANLPDKFLRRLELDYDSLRAIKPDIILVTNSAFGNSGPYAEKVGFDGIAQSMSGAVWYSGQPDQPSKSTIHFVDFSTALSATIGVLVAIMEKQRTGTGQVVGTSLLGTALTLANGTLIEQAVIDRNRVPTGNRGQVAAPADIFKTVDGHVIIQVVGPWMFKRFVQLIGKEEWLDDPRFKDDLSRGDHADVLNDFVAEWCASRTTDEVLQAMESARLPAGPILSWQEALDHPAVQALGHLQPMAFPGTPSPPPVANTPFSLSNSEVGLTRRAPMVGEHTEEILHDIGYDAEQITRLRTSGIV